MNVLILGAGGRENALALAIAKSEGLGALFVAPGNPGCEKVAHRVVLDPAQASQVVAFCLTNAIDLVVVGPEAPLVAGVSDALADAGIACSGLAKPRRGWRDRKASPKTSARNSASRPGPINAFPTARRLWPTFARSARRSS